MEKKQTAVDWLQAYLPDVNQPEYFRRAKEIEKRQIIEFARGFWYYAYGSDAPPVYPEDVEKFYKKYMEK